MSTIAFASDNRWEHGVTEIINLLDGSNDLPIAECESIAHGTVWFMYQLTIDGSYQPPSDGRQGNYMLTINDEIVYVGCTKNLRYRVLTNSVIKFAATRSGFALWWMPFGNFQTERLLRKYLHPLWNGYQLKESRPFHDCGTTVTSGARPYCTLRYSSTVHLDRRNLFDIREKSLAYAL